MCLIIYDPIEIFMYLLGRGFKLKKTENSYLGKKVSFTHVNEKQDRRYSDPKARNG